MLHCHSIVFLEPSSASTIKPGPPGCGHVGSGVDSSGAVSPPVESAGRCSDLGPHSSTGIGNQLEPLVSLELLGGVQAMPQSLSEVFVGFMKPPSAFTMAFTGSLSLDHFRFLIGSK